MHDRPDAIAGNIIGCIHMRHEADRGSINAALDACAEDLLLAIERFDAKRLQLFLQMQEQALLTLCRWPYALIGPGPIAHGVIGSVI